MTDAPAFTEGDWAKVEAQAVHRLRAKKVPDIPEKIKALAQESWDGRVNPKAGQPGEPEKLHALRYRFSSVEMAAEFARLMKKAGDHTKPLTTVSVVIDPDRLPGKPAVDERVVAWHARPKRTRVVKPK